MFLVISKHMCLSIWIEFYQWVGKGHYMKYEEIAILVFYLQFSSATTTKKREFLMLKIKKAKVPEEASAIYSSSDISFIRTWKEQNHLKMDARHLVPTTEFI